MTEKPILFSTPMVQAILAGRKTMTRRVAPEQLLEKYSDYDDYCNAVMPRDIPCTRTYEKEFYMERARYQVGDILWVRETWCDVEKDFVPDKDMYVGDCRYVFKVDDNGVSQPLINVCVKKWRPSIFMPRTAARLFLKVKDIRVERLQDITEEDARAEGCIDYHDKIGDGKFDDVAEFDLTARDAFAELWDNINSKRGYAWGTNPWVWAVSFERANP